MFRPALVVGLGGTGSWVNDILKARLRTDSRWLELEANPQADISAYNNDSTGVFIRALDVDHIKRPVVGDVGLDVHEDIPIDAKVGDAISHLKSLRPGDKCSYPTLEAWLSREEAEKMEISDAVKFMTTGAGQIRAFGRMAFFLDVLNKKTVLNRLSSAIGSLTQSAGAQELTVFVTASVAGGTGAGLLVDVLAYLQDVRKKLAGQIPFRTVVFAVLPGAFRSVLDADQLENAQANGYATLRELDRLVNAYETVELEYEPGVPVRLSASAADHVYLVDGSRDVDGGVQLEGYDPAEDALPVGVADAIYTHLLPSSGAVLVRDYPNLLEALISGQPNRYSSFGTYVIDYAWEPLTRAFALRAAGDIIRELLAPGGENAYELAQIFLAGTGMDQFMREGQEQPLPSLVRDVLHSEGAPRGELAPGPFWLEPPTDAAPFPLVPTLRENFPDIGRIRTPYNNDQVIQETKKALEAFWGGDYGRWNRNVQPQFLPVANYNADICESKFELALLAAVTAVMSRQNGIGGLDTGLHFLDSVDKTLESYGTYLGNVPQPNLAELQSDVDDAIAELQKQGKLDDAHDQRRYLQAEQELLQQQVVDQCLKRAQALIGRFRHVVTAATQEVQIWHGNLETIARDVTAQRHLHDNDRTRSNDLPLRRVVPLPGDSVDHKLYDECAGSVNDDPLPQKIMDSLKRFSWSVWVKPGNQPRIILQHPGFGEESDEPVPVEVDHLVKETSSLFAHLRDLSVMDILERGSEAADGLANEIRSSGARLAAFDATAQLQVTVNNVGVQNWDYAFAPWRSEGPGGQLSDALRQQLTRLGVSCEDLAASPTGETLPAQDKILFFSARHLIAPRAFRGVAALEQAYIAKRLNVPSPHVLPEEKGAAQLEARSVQFEHDGLLHRNLGQLQPENVPLCSDFLFLRYFAATAAGDLLEWKFTDPIAKTGTWTVTKPGSEEVATIGTEADPAELLRRLVRGTDYGSRTARDVIREAGANFAGSDGSQDALRNFALNGSPGLGEIDEEVALILKAAAAALIA